MVGDHKRNGNAGQCRMAQGVAHQGPAPQEGEAADHAGRAAQHRGAQQHDASVVVAQQQNTAPMFRRGPLERMVA